MTIKVCSKEDRETKLKKAIKKGSDKTHAVPFQGKTQDLKVYEVLIGVPCYRLNNQRIELYQEQYIVENQKPEDFFSREDSKETLNAQHEILWKLVNRSAKKKEIFDILEGGSQTDPLIVTDKGVVVDGNRRLCCMRELNAKDAQKYPTVRIAVLPDHSEVDIEVFETARQMGPTGHDPYDWMAKHKSIKKRLDSDQWNDEAIMEHFDINSKPKIFEMVGMFDLAERYLEQVGKMKMWDLVERHEEAFRKLYKERKRKIDKGEREEAELGTAIVHQLLQAPSSDLTGRLYSSIPKIFKNTVSEPNLERFRDEISKAHKIKLTTTKGSKGDLDLPGDPESTPFCDPVFVGKVRKLKNSVFVKTISSTLDEIEDLKRNEDNYDLTLKYMSDANSDLKKALHSIDSERNLRGMKAQIKECNSTLNSIGDKIENV